MTRNTWLAAGLMAGIAATAAAQSNADIHMYTPDNSTQNVWWNLEGGELQEAREGTAGDGTIITGDSFTLYNPDLVETVFTFTASGARKRLHTVDGNSPASTNYHVLTGQNAAGEHVIEVDANNVINQVRFVKEDDTTKSQQFSPTHPQTDHDDLKSQQVKKTFVLTGSPAGTSGPHNFFFRKRSKFPSLICVHRASDGQQLRWAFGPGLPNYAIFTTQGRLTAPSQADDAAVPLRLSFTPVGLLHKVEQHKNGQWTEVDKAHGNFWIHSGDNGGKLAFEKFSVKGRAPGKRYPVPAAGGGGSIDPAL